MGRHSLLMLGGHLGTTSSTSSGDCKQVRMKHVLEEKSTDKGQP